MPTSTRAGRVRRPCRCRPARECRRPVGRTARTMRLPSRPVRARPIPDRPLHRRIRRRRWAGRTAGCRWAAWGSARRDLAARGPTAAPREDRWGGRRTAVRRSRAPLPGWRGRHDTQLVCAVVHLLVPRRTHCVLRSRGARKPTRSALPRGGARHRCLAWHREPPDAVRPASRPQSRASGRPTRMAAGARGRAGGCDRHGGGRRARPVGLRRHRPSRQRLSAGDRRDGRDRGRWHDHVHRGRRGDRRHQGQA